MYKNARVHAISNQATVQSHQALFVALMEELKLPLVKIKHGSQINQLSAIDDAAEQALELIDAYMLCFADNKQSRLELEPVGISSAMHDIAHQLHSIGNSYNSSVRLITNHCKPVMINRQAFKNLFLLLGRSIMAAQSSQESGKFELTLQYRQHKNDIVAGVYSNRVFNKEALKTAHSLVGQARQSLPGQTHINGASLFVADAIAQLFASPIFSSKQRNLYGPAIKLRPSNQLQLL